MSWRAALVVGALAASLALPAAPRAGTVDWLRREVACSGAGAPRLREEVENVTVTRGGTERAARAGARRACREVLWALLVERGETVAARVARDPATAAAVERVVRRTPPRAPPRFFADGGVEVDLVLPLDGPLSELLLGGGGGPRAASGAGAAGAVTPPGAPAEASSPAEVPAADAATGLLVDATGLAVAPALGPRLLDEAGAEVYSPAVLAPAARAAGGAAYATSVAAARAGQAARLGPAPRVVKAVRAEGPDLVLADRDARDVRGRAFLAAGRVVIAGLP